MLYNSQSTQGWVDRYVMLSLACSECTLRLPHACFWLETLEAVMCNHVKHFLEPVSTNPPETCGLYICIHPHVLLALLPQT